MFTWDEDKRRKNLAKHGIDFARAAEMDFDRTICWVDERRDYGETRYVALGPAEDELFVSVYVIRDGFYRIISLRKANRRERGFYEEEIETFDE